MQFKWRRLSYYLYSLNILRRQTEILSLGKLIVDSFLNAEGIKTVHLNKFNLKFRLRTLLDLLVLKEVVLDEEYESFGVKISHKDRVIVDIGGGFGDFSILVAKKFLGRRYLRSYLFFSV